MSHNINGRINPVVFRVLLVLGPIIVGLAAIGIGRYSIGFTESIQKFFIGVMGLLTGKETLTDLEYSVIFNLRLSRIILAALAGAGLAVAGAALQAMFSNPLVSPDTLGVGAGASFGAVLALLLGMGQLEVQLMAITMGIIAILLTYTVATGRTGKSSIIMLVLSGMTISALFSALVSLAKYSADTQDELPAITFWLMGSLTKASFETLKYGAPFIIVGIVVLYLIRWKLNILSLSEEEAKTLGINVRAFRAVVIISSSMITAAVVSMCGLIGWVGLLIPHVARLLFGSNNCNVIPVSISLGAIFFIIVDTLSRSMFATEVPVSILTAIIGAPCFIILLKKQGGAN